jgi:hypothetical protein
MLKSLAFGFISSQRTQDRVNKEKRVVKKILRILLVLGALFCGLLVYIGLVANGRETAWQVQHHPSERDFGPTTMEPHPESDPLNHAVAEAQKRNQFGGVHVDPKDVPPQKQPDAIPELGLCPTGASRYDLPKVQYEGVVIAQGTRINTYQCINEVKLKMMWKQGLDEYGTVQWKGAQSDKLGVWKLRSEDGQSGFEKYQCPTLKPGTEVQVTPYAYDHGTCGLNSQVRLILPYRKLSGYFDAHTLERETTEQEKPEDSMEDEDGRPVSQN